MSKGTTPSTDLPHIQQVFQHHIFDEGAHEALPVEECSECLKELTEVITQERNKAWEEATAKFEACLPEKYPDGYKHPYTEAWNEAIDQIRDNWYKG